MTAASEQLRIEHVSLDDFDRMETEWNSLLEHSDSASVFMTWDYLYTWWRYFGLRIAEPSAASSGRPHRLLLLAAYKARELVGIAPLYLAHRADGGTEVRFLGSGELVSPDYLDFIVDPRQGSSDVRAAFLAFLWQHFPSSRITLTDIGADAFFESALHRIDRLRYVKEVCALCSYVTLPKDWDTYLSQLSQRFRHNLNRGIRALTRPEAASFVAAATPSDVAVSLEALKAMHAARWGAQGLSSRYLNQSYFAFHREVACRMLTKGWLRLYTLHYDVPLAILYCYEYKGKTYYYSGSFVTTSAHTKHSPGNVARALAIRNAIESGGAEFDFLRGEADYKGHWCNASRQTFTYYLVPSGLHGQWLMRDVYIRFAKRRVKGVLERFASPAERPPAIERKPA